MIDHRHTGRLQGNSYQHRLSSSEPDQQRTAHHQRKVQASANHRWTCDRKPSHLFWASLINFTYKGRVYPGLMDHVRKKNAQTERPFCATHMPLDASSPSGQGPPENGGRSQIVLVAMQLGRIVQVQLDLSHGFTDVHSSPLASTLDKSSNQRSCFVANCRIWQPYQCF